MDSAVTHPDGPRHRGKQKKTNLKTIITVAALIASVLVVVLGGWLAYRSATSVGVDESKYQAVFLTNGQVYFGKLDMSGGEYITLNDIFYLQARSADGSPENPQETSDQNASDVQLIKLGTEIHGPEDKMIISRDQMLFFENLKEDGKVSTSIGDYYSGQGQQNTESTLREDTAE